MTQSEINLLKKALRLMAQSVGRPLRVLEWGAGASTVHFSRYLRDNRVPFEWNAIDNSADWYMRVTTSIRDAGLASSVSVHLSEFQPFWEDSGWDRRNWKWKDQPPCTQTIAAYIDWPRKLGGKFDLVIIDGRYRKRCLLTTREILDDRGLVFLHDAWRTHYRDGVVVFGHGRYFTAGRLPGSERSVAWIGTIANRDLLADVLVGEQLLSLDSPMKDVGSLASAGKGDSAGGD